MDLYVYAHHTGSKRDGLAERQLSLGYCLVIDSRPEDLFLARALMRECFHVCFVLFIVLPSVCFPSTVFEAVYNFDMWYLT